MSEALIRRDIKTALESVYQVGCVYDYEPFMSTWTEFLDHYKVTVNEAEVIRGWTISCTEISAEGFIATGKRNTGNARMYTYTINGYFGVYEGGQTETEVFPTVIAVMDALDARDLTSQTLGTTITAGLAQLATFGQSPLAGALTHFAEITQTVTESN